MNILSWLLVLESVLKAKSECRWFNHELTTSSGHSVVDDILTKEQCQEICITREAYSVVYDNSEKLCNCRNGVIQSFQPNDGVYIWEHIFCGLRESRNSDVQFPTTYTVYVGFNLYYMNEDTALSIFAVDSLESLIKSDRILFEPSDEFSRDYGELKLSNRTVVVNEVIFKRHQDRVKRSDAISYTLTNGDFGYQSIWLTAVTANEKVVAMSLSRIDIQAVTKDCKLQITHLTGRLKNGVFLVDMDLEVLGNTDVENVTIYFQTMNTFKFQGVKYYFMVETNRTIGKGFVAFQFARLFRFSKISIDFLFSVEATESQVGESYVSFLAVFQSTGFRNGSANEDIEERLLGATLERIMKSDNVVYPKNALNSIATMAITRNEELFVCLHTKAARELPCFMYNKNDQTVTVFPRHVALIVGHNYMTNYITAKDRNGNVLMILNGQWEFISADAYEKELNGSQFIESRQGGENAFEGVDLKVTENGVKIRSSDAFAVVYKSGD